MQQGWKHAALTLAAAAALVGPASAQGGDVILTPPPGAPAPGPSFTVRPGLIGFGAGAATMLRMPAVQAELKLTGEQKSQLADLLRRLREEQRERFQELRDLAPTERGSRQAEWRASEAKQVNAILTPEQQKRFRQLRLQRAGILALLEPDVAAELKLTEEQRGQVQGALRDQDDAMRSLLQPGPGGFDPEQTRQKIEAQFQQRDEKILAALTLEQRRQWQSLLGAPFAFPQFGPHPHEPLGGRAPEDSPLPADAPAILEPVSP